MDQQKDKSNSVNQNQLYEEIKEIKTNHLFHIANDLEDVKIKLLTHCETLAHIEKDLIEIKVNYAVFGADLAWLRKFLWIVVSASVGSFMAGLFNLL